MRFHVGAPPEVASFRPDEQGWQPLREPSPVLLILVYSIPVFLALAVTFFLLWRPLIPAFHGRVAIDGWWVVAFLAIIPPHEVLHMLAHPGNGRSPATVMGVWLKVLAPYAHYEGELTRERFMIILAAPFVVISVVPLVVAYVFSISSYPLALASIANAGGACADVIGVVLVSAQVPYGATVRNQSMKTYWRR